MEVIVKRKSALFQTLKKKKKRGGKQCDCHEILLSSTTPPKMCPLPFLRKERIAKNSVRSERGSQAGAGRVSGVYALFFGACGTHSPHALARHALLLLRESEGHVCTNDKQGGLSVQCGLVYLNVQ